MHQPAIVHPFHHTTAHVSGVAAIPAVLRALGASPARVFAEAGVDLLLFDDPEGLISLVEVGRLVKHAVATTGCQHFGLLVGQQGGLHSLGLVGLVVRYSPDVGTALRRLGHYLHLYHGGQMTALVEEGRMAALSYAFLEPEVEGIDQIEDGALAIMCNMLRALCGPDWQPVEVRLAHRAPDNVRPFSRFFRATLRFNAEQSALVMSTDWLHRRLPDAGAELQRLLKREIEALEARHGDDFPAQVRSVLRTGLLTGHASADQVAELFSIHSRTLTRRLKAFGCNFKTLVDEGRFEIAREMLQNTSLDVSRIAASLDYADASAFTRAFRRWSGTTPAAWRATSGHTNQESNGASASRSSIKRDDEAASSMITDHRFMTSQPVTSPGPSR
jgi:AraC-like DNA-binding protein